MTEPLVDRYVQTCEVLSLNSGQRRRLWFAVAAEIGRVEAALTNPDMATDEEIEAVCDRLKVRTVETLGLRIREEVLLPGPRLVAANAEAELPPHELLVKHWNEIEKLIAKTARKQNLDPAEADALETQVKLKFFERDCAIVRGFRGRSSFMTYVKTIVQWTYADLEVKRVGKWHYSATAERLGPTAKRLERMIYRDGYTPNEAMSVLLTMDRSLTLHQLEDLYRQLPIKSHRPVKVSLEGTEELANGEEADILISAGERRRFTGVALTIIQRFMKELPDADRLLLQFLSKGMRISKIAEQLQKDQKALYRRRDDLYAQLKQELARAGITAWDAVDLNGHIFDDRA